jgi:hypothetical protein
MKNIFALLFPKIEQTDDSLAKFAKIVLRLLPFWFAAGVVVVLARLFR